MRLLALVTSLHKLQLYQATTLLDYCGPGQPWRLDRKFNIGNSVL
jgi:hypothetical protein